jgi:uncharacterized protein YkwD
MMRPLTRCALALTVIAAALLPACPSHAQLLQNDLLWKINDTRVAYGLQPLIPVNEMTEAASFHAGDMFRNNIEGHIGSNGLDGGQRLHLVGYNASAWGEIVGHAYANGDQTYLWDNAQMLNWWMNSPPHRANILNPSFTEIGLGISTGPRDSGGQTVYHRYWCVVFGTR